MVTPRVQLAPNFFLDEFDCHDGTAVPQALVPNVENLVVQVLQKIRDRFGKALYVICGFRTLAHNTAVGGAPASAHLTAEGGDVSPVVRSEAEVSQLYDLVLAMYQAGDLPALGGLGYYPGKWLHLDTRKAPDGHLRRWVGTKVGSEPGLSLTQGSTPETLTE